MTKVKIAGYIVLLETFIEASKVVHKPLKAVN